MRYNKYLQNTLVGIYVSLYYTIQRTAFGFPRFGLLDSNSKLLITKDFGQAWNWGLGQIQVPFGSRHTRHRSVKKKRIIYLF
jgi:hypothetical protein